MHILKNPPKIRKGMPRISRRFNTSTILINLKVSTKGIVETEVYLAPNSDIVTAVEIHRRSPDEIRALKVVFLTDFLSFK